MPDTMRRPPACTVSERRARGLSPRQGARDEPALNREPRAPSTPRDRASQPRHVPVRVVRGNWYRVLAYRPPKSRLSSDVTLRILDYGVIGIPIVERSSISTHLGETSPIHLALGENESARQDLRLVKEPL